MYELGPAFPDVSVEPGTNLLVSGPAMTGKREFGYDVLAEGCADGDGAVVVSTTEDVETVLGDLQERLSGESVVGVVDCVSRQQGMGSDDDRPLVRYTSSPNDLTGIGIEFSNILEAVHGEHGRTRNRVLLHSVSTLLMYSELQTVFRFLHVFTGRVRSADALGLYVLDSTAHEQQELSTIKQLFDGVIEFRETEEGRERRIVGLEGVETGWQPH